jgi:hypothetical protein
MSAPWIAAFLALCGFVVLLGLIVLGTLRRIAPLLERAEAALATGPQRAPGGLRSGARVPPFAGKVVDGSTFTEQDLLRRRAVVLFVGASCAACERLIIDLEAGRIPDLSSRLFVVSEYADEAERFAPSAEVTVVVDPQRSIAKAFESEVVPNAYVVEDGTILASGRPNDWEAIETLISTQEGGDLQPDLAAEALTSR